MMINVLKTSGNVQTPKTNVIDLFCQVPVVTSKGTLCSTGLAFEIPVGVIAIAFLFDGSTKVITTEDSKTEIGFLFEKTVSENEYIGKLVFFNVSQIFFEEVFGF